MSKKYEANSCGFKPAFNGPATVEEYDAKGGPNACLEDAVYNTIWRDTLPEWQAAFTPKLEELTGVKREVNASATEAAKKRAKNPDNVSPILETFKAFAARAVAAYAGDDAEKLAELELLAQEVADGIEVDPSPNVRVSTINKGHLAKADEILGRSDDKIEATVSKLLDVVSDFELARDDEGKPERNSLARLVGRFMQAGI